MLEAPTSPVSSHRQESLSPVRRHLWIAAIVIALIGIFLRVYPSAGYKEMGFDEALYRTFAQMLDAKGPARYAEVFEAHLADQRRAEVQAKLPPTRVGYIFAGWLWKRMEFGSAPPLDLRVHGNIDRDPMLVSLHRVSCLFSILLLLVTGIAAWRMISPEAGVGVLALMSFGPLPLHMSQHALIDGVFAFWATLAIWSLWECLRRPNHTGWLAVYCASIAFMVITKENAFFVFCALCGIIVANRWAEWGQVTPRLLLTTAMGALIGAALLVTLAGGVDILIETFRLLVSKAQKLDYAIMTGDGPWYRYLVDLLLISPIVLCLAVGGMFQLPRHRSVYLYLLAFVAFSYLVMCNVRYGMNLRYASIWDLPLRVFAVGQLSLLAQRFGRRQMVVLCVAVAALCAYELRQYVILFHDGALYEVITAELLTAVKILK